MATDTKYSSIFGVTAIDKVGNIGTIYDNTYNVPWVIYTISGNTYQLFPMQNLTSRGMNSTTTNTGGYTASDMYTYIHNTILPNLKRSGLNITACDLVSLSVYNDICSKTGKTSKGITNGEDFWLTNPYNSYYFYCVYSDGSFIGYADYSRGVRPLITVIKD